MNSYYEESFFDCQSLTSVVKAPYIFPSPWVFRDLGTDLDAFQYREQIPTKAICSTAKAPYCLILSDDRYTLRKAVTATCILVT